jgi:hypothetical protein
MFRSRYGAVDVGSEACEIPGTMSTDGNREGRTRPALETGAGRIAGDLGGAFGDLGTFLPHVLGAITVAGLAPTGVLLGFGLFYVTSGLFYRLPIPVQPMKAVSAVLITAGLSAGRSSRRRCLRLILLAGGERGVGRLPGSC